MKNYRNVLAALTLALVLLTPALAGDGVMHTGIVAPTPTPTPITTTGIMHTGVTEEQARGAGAESEPAAAGIVAEIALDLLRGVLTLF